MNFRLTLYKAARAVIVLASRMPFCVIYVISDFFYLLIYRVARYRRSTVRRNLANSFPEKSEAERRSIERKFYHAFCDSVVEWFKLFTMSPEEMRRRMSFSGTEEMGRSMDKKGMCFIYLGHFCNWEWISSLPIWFDAEKVHCGQLYHPLHGKFADWLFYGMRCRFGAENIPKKDALRRIITLRRGEKNALIGFIADQGPRWVNIHEWVDFLNQDTPVYTGTERIAKKMDAAVYFADVSCVKRGYYHCTFELMTEDPNSYEGFGLTDEYMRRLERMIRREPERWLWTHKRWKRHHDVEPQMIEKRNEKQHAASAADHA